MSVDERVLERIFKLEMLAKFKRFIDDCPSGRLPVMGKTFAPQDVCPSVVCPSGRLPLWTFVRQSFARHSFARHVNGFPCKCLPE